VAPSQTEAPIFRPFRPGDETAFWELNEAWIRQIFAIEDKDIEVLRHPVEYILNPGGEIVMVDLSGRTIGCCALLVMPKHAETTFEIGKMAVVEELRGAGIGRKLLAHMIRRGWERGAQRLYLETSTKLPNAVHLYEALGFRHLPPERVTPSPYARSNVYMELLRPVSART
jgi:GNAT superfamily N-acetyltransferase